MIRVIEYLVVWSNVPEHDATWESITKVKQLSPNAIKMYEQQRINDEQSLRSGDDVWA